jgi:hypothetical protein
MFATRMLRDGQGKTRAEEPAGFVKGEATLRTEAEASYAAIANSDGASATAST